MNPSVYRDQIIRAVFGTSTAPLPPDANVEMLECLCQRLSEREQAMFLFRQKGYTEFGESIVQVAELLPKVMLSRFRSNKQQHNK